MRLRPAQHCEKISGRSDRRRVWRLSRASEASSAAKGIVQLNTLMERIRYENRGEAYDGDLGSESEPLRLQDTVLWNEGAGAAET